MKPQVAASLRRGEVLDHILWRMRQEVLAPRMMRAALDALVNALGAEGAAVIDMIGDGAPTPPWLHSGRHARLPPGAADGRRALLRERRRAEPAQALPPRTGGWCWSARAADAVRRADRLALWRAAGARAWDLDEPPAGRLRHRHHPRRAGARRDPARDGAAGTHRPAHRAAQPARLPRGAAAPCSTGSTARSCRAR